MRERELRFVMTFGCLLFVGSVRGADQNDQTRQITVFGEAEVKVVPDEVILTLGVETLDKDINVAKKMNDEIVKKVLGLAKEFSIDPGSVKTDYLNVEPAYENYTRKNFVGFYVRKTIVFSLKSLSKFDDLLSRALESGANYVHGIQFRTTELRKYRDQARADALKAARDKAMAMAKELDQRIGQPKTIQETYGGSGYWGDGGWGPRWGNAYQPQNALTLNGRLSDTPEVSFSPGKISVSAKVTVTFELAN